MGAVKTSTPTGDKKTKVKKPKRKSCQETYSKYIFRILKQYQQDKSISKDSMSVMNSFINDILERILLEASKLSRANKKHTISTREIQTSLKLLLPGELGKFAHVAGMSAIKSERQG